MVKDEGLAELTSIGAEIDRIIADRAIGRDGDKGAIAALVERLARLDDVPMPPVHPPIGRTSSGYVW